MLQGKLVRLRAVEPEDTERGHKWINDREVTRNLMARYPFSMVQEREYMEQTAAKPNGFPNDVRLGIETPEGVHIGFVGLHRIMPEDRHAELGIMIGEKEYWSKGYGTDAIRTLLRFAFDEMNLHRVSLSVLEFNERGMACYRKCGFMEEGRMREARYLDGRYWDIVQMSVLQPEYEAVRGSWS